MYDFAAENELELGRHSSAPAQVFDRLNSFLL